jgi:hypothetical protein
MFAVMVRTLRMIAAQGTPVPHLSKSGAAGRH